MHGAIYKGAQIRDSLMDILDMAIKLDGAAKGNLQLLDQSVGGLEIALQRGFNLPFLQLFHLVRADDPCPCGRAFRYKHRVLVPNIANDFLYWPYRSIARANGYEAVQSTPIIGTDGTVKGVFSTHYRKAHHFSDRAVAALDNCAYRMACLLDAHGRDGKDGYAMIKSDLNDTLVWS